MLRLSRVFSNHATTIIKVEGRIRETDLPLLQSELEAVRRINNGEVVLNLASTSSVTPKIVIVLKSFLGKNVFLMSCEPYLRNMIQASGLSAMVLD